MPTRPGLVCGHGGKIDRPVVDLLGATLSVKALVKVHRSLIRPLELLTGWDWTTAGNRSSELLKLGSDGSRF